jgi:hypothetical protein
MTTTPKGKRTSAIYHYKSGNGIKVNASLAREQSGNDGTDHKREIKVPMDLSSLIGYNS